MKDKTVRLISRAVPYDAVTPRRPLRDVVGVTQGGKVVRQANPNCALPQTRSTSSGNTCTDVLTPTKKRSFNLHSTKTCAALACTTGRDIREAFPIGYPIRSNAWDTRCAVATPPREWTEPASFVTNLFGNYEGINDTVKKLSIYDISGATYSGPDYRTGYPWLFPNVAVEYDVLYEQCEQGRTNSTIARQIQCSLGVRSDCNATASSSTIALAKTTSQQTSIPSTAASAKTTSQQINILPTIGPASPTSTGQHDKVAQTSSTALLSTAGATLLATAAATLLPTPTATIAASVPLLSVSTPALIISGVAGLGALGGGVLAGYVAVRKYSAVKEDLPKAPERGPAIPSAPPLSDVWGGWTSTEV